MQPTPLDFGDYESASRVVRNLNSALGVGPQAERAMLVGCLTGWEGVQQQGPVGSWQTGVTIH